MASKLLLPLLSLTLFFLPLTNAISFSVKLKHQNKTFSSLSSISPNSMASPVIPNNADHLMEFSIGTPPMKVRAIVDTGSDLIWSRCKPCVECNGHTFPVFDPALSSTYKNVACDSSFCKSLHGACSQGSTCEYDYGYGGGSFTKGIVGTETLTFGSTDGKSVVIPSIVFGCGHNNSASFDDRQIGLVGLGGSPTSLISQIGPSIGWKFSYCLVPFMETSSSSIMNFGDAAIVSGKDVVSTPLIPKEDMTYYYVTLERITVGNYKIDASATGVGNTFIDSGTTVTILNTKVFNQLADAVADIVKLPRTTDPGKTFACYKATSRDKFPLITFGFAGGADLVLEPMNAFTVPSQDGLVCLSMQATEGTAVFGNLAQQNFHIGYDLEGKKVSFQPAKCSQMSP